MASQGRTPRRSLSVLQARKKTFDNVGGADLRRKSMAILRSPSTLTGEMTVRRLRLSKALTIPETTTIYDACKRMAVHRVDALLLTDSNALLCGILTAKDIATKVIANEVNLEETPVSKVMTRNPVFVLADTLVVEALQKMVQGKFRHLTVIDNGEVVAILDISKCLYDVIARMERADEKGKAIAAVIEGVERNWGTSLSGPNAFIETLKDRMFRPFLSTIIPENTKVLKVATSDTVLTATKKMLEFRLSCACVMNKDKLQGILTSKDILMRMVAENLPPDSTTLDKIMTPNPECATVDTAIVDALHVMHDGRFLHLPVTDKGAGGDVVAILDVLHITQAAIATAGSSAAIGNETGLTMQKFWDSTMALSPLENEEESRSEGSLKIASEVDTGKQFSYPNMLSFKIQDRKGRMHRFICGDDINQDNLPQILYEDEDHDRVLLASDSDLAAAVLHARSLAWKSLRLHLDYSKGRSRRRASGSENLDFVQSDSWSVAYSTVAAGATLMAGLGLIAFLRKYGN